MTKVQVAVPPLLTRGLLQFRCPIVFISTWHPVTIHATLYHILHTINHLFFAALVKGGRFCTVSAGGHAAPAAMAGFGGVVEIQNACLALAFLNSREISVTKQVHGGFSDREQEISNVVHLYLKLLLEAFCRLDDLEMTFFFAQNLVDPRDDRSRNRFAVSKGFRH